MTFGGHKTDNFFIQQSAPVKLVILLHDLDLIIQIPVGAAVLRPAIVEVSHTANKRVKNSSAGCDVCQVVVSLQGGENVDVIVCGKQNLMVCEVSSFRCV